MYCIYKISPNMICLQKALWLNIFDPIQLNSYIFKCEMYMKYTNIVVASVHMYSTKMYFYTELLIKYTKMCNRILT